MGRGKAGEVPKTDRIRHVTWETKDVKTTLRGDVRDDVIEMTIPLVREAMDGGEAKAGGTGFWFSASVELGSLRVGIRHEALGRQDVVTMTVHPPLVDGEPADVNVSISGLMAAIANGTDMVEGSVLNSVAMLGDLERCLAWAWLVDAGHA